MAIQMKYQVVVEYDPSSRHFTATVAGIPNIVVDAKSERGAVRLAREAIEVFMRERPNSVPEPGPRETTVRAKIVAVEV
jgi:predicted RNase H-like HicB family nuclease